MNMNINTNMHRQNFTGGKRIEISQKDNANMKFLYNQVQDIIKEHKAPAIFEMGEGRITINTLTKKIADSVSESLKNLGIVSTTPKK